MKIKTLEKLQKTFLILAIILLIFTSVGWLYLEALLPAGSSYLSQCNQEAHEKYYPDYITVAQTDGTTGEVEQFIFNLPKDYQKLVDRHESIHQNQILKRNANITCRNLYFYEVEAYLMDESPDWLFNTLYQSL